MLSVSPVVGIGTPSTPHPDASVPPPPPPFGSGRRGTLAGERGVGRVPIPTRGHSLWCSYMYVLCDYIDQEDMNMKRKTKETWRGEEEAQARKKRGRREGSVRRVKRDQKEEKKEEEKREVEEMRKKGRKGR